MQMKIGMPTLIEVPDIIRTVELCKELGLSFIELNMNMPEFCPEKLDYALVKNYRRRLPGWPAEGTTVCQKK